MYATAPSIVSARLCVGMFVAKPTAMPDAPLTSRLGKRPGTISGSFKVSSKLQPQRTISSSGLPMSFNSSMASGVSRHSV